MSRKRRVLTLICAAVVTAAGLSAAGGCYRRVTRATGFGADQYNISEPYQQDTRADRWFYGKEDKDAAIRRGSLLP